MDPRTEVQTLLRAHGRFMRQNKHAVYNVNGHTIIVPTSASDNKRGWLNLRSVIRRALAQPAQPQSYAAAA